MRPRGVIALVALGALGVALSARPAAADAAPSPCGAWDVEYNLSARLQLEDTPMGEGDGVYTIGPGRMVLRYDDQNGEPGGTVNMISYAMREHFVIKSKTLFWTTTVTTDTRTRVTPDVCASAAEGSLTDHTIVWRSPVRGYRTDGTLECDGSLCGKFGAPPPGKTELHIGPGPVTFNTFDFAPDRATFLMTKAQVTKTEMPKQTGFVAIAGREVKRTCVTARPCAARR